MTKVTRCLDPMASLLCELKNGHKGNHRYKTQYWNKKGEFLGSIPKGNSG